jgi:hypothetical protein
MPRGLRQIALSISFLSPIFRRPAAFAVTKIASLIIRPERRFLALTSFQSLRRPSLSFGSSSLSSLRKQSLSLSRARLRPPGNIQSPSRFRLTSNTRPRFAATSFEDFAIPHKVISVEPISYPTLRPVQNLNEGRFSPPEPAADIKQLLFAHRAAPATAPASRVRSASVFQAALKAQFATAVFGDGTSALTVKPRRRLYAAPSALSSFSFGGT